jgi:hypothetical protein
MGLEIFHSQQEMASTRSRTLDLVQTETLRAAWNPAGTASLLPLARQAQDMIFATRKSHARVPDWFFRRFRDEDRSDFRDALSRLYGAVGVGHHGGEPHERY